MYRMARRGGVEGGVRQWVQILSVRGGGSIIDLFRRRLTALTELSTILRPGGTKNKFARRQERKREMKGEWEESKETVGVLHVGCCLHF